MKNLALWTVSGGLFAAPTIAVAQETSGYPDMRGRRKGTNKGVVLGSGNTGAGPEILRHVAPLGSEHLSLTGD